MSSILDDDYTSQQPTGSSIADDNTPVEKDLPTDIVSLVNPNLSMMDKVSKDDQTFADIKMLTSSKVTDQLKVFLVSQARNELSRVVKLTRFLDKLESRFMTKVDKAIDSDDLTLKQYSDIIGVITSLLARSNDIISKVLNDDSLMLILNSTVYTTTGGTQTSVVSTLKDAQSREKVRMVLQQIISRTEEYTSSYESQDDSSDDINIDIEEEENNNE